MSFSRMVPIACGPVAAASRSASETRSIMIRVFRNTVSSGKPTVVFVPGFMSHGRGHKAMFLEKHCQTKGYNYVCYDPEGLCESPADFQSLQLAHWFDDCRTVIDVCKQENLCSSGIVLVASSMGAWISLKMAMEFPAQIKALLLIAPSINFMWNKYVEWYNGLDDDTQKKLDSGHTHFLDTEHGQMLVRKDFAVKSRELELDTSKPFAILCPVTIFHGVEDDVVPFERSMKLMDLIGHDHVDLVYRKRGNHRLSNDRDLEMIGSLLELIMVKM